MPICWLNVYVRNWSDFLHDMYYIYPEHRGLESRSKPEFFSGHFSSSVKASFASYILSLLATVGHLLLL